MPTKNPRFSVSFSDDIVIKFLTHYSKERNISVSRMISFLVEKAMEDFEDFELSKIANEAWERNKDKPKFSHEEVMKECGLM